MLPKTRNQADRGQDSGESIFITYLGGHALFEEFWEQLKCFLSRM